MDTRVGSGICANYKMSSAKEVALNQVRMNGLLLALIEEPWNHDMDVIEVALTNTVYSYQHVPKDLRSDKILALRVVRKRGYTYKWVLGNARLDPDVMIEAVKNDGSVIWMLPPEYQKDRTIIQAAIENRPELIGQF